MVHKIRDMGHRHSNARHLLTTFTISMITDGPGAMNNIPGKILLQLLHQKCPILMLSLPSGDGARLINRCKLAPSSRKGVPTDFQKSAEQNHNLI